MSAKSVYTNSTNGTTASNIWSFSPIGSVSGDTPVAGTAGSSETSNSKTDTTTGAVTYSGSRTTNYAVSANTTFYLVYIYGSATVGATSGSSNSAWLGDAAGSGSTYATTGYSFLDKTVAESFASTLKTRVNASSSNYFYSEYAKANFYYIDSYEVYSNTFSITIYLPYTYNISFSGGYYTTYSTFQH